MLRRRILCIISSLIILTFVLVGCGLLKKEYTLDVLVDGEGLVNISPLEEKYIEDTIVTLTAVPQDGWQFDHWEGDAEGDNSQLELLMDDNKEITAVFVRQDFVLTVNVTGEGQVEKEILNGATNTYPYETVVKLTAIPSVGWEFSHWEGDGNGSNPVIELTFDEDKNVTAVFVRIGYTLNITVEGQGRVREEIVANAASDYFHGQLVKLTAMPDAGWKFVEWTGDFTGQEEQVEVLMDDNKSITAVFAREEYTLNITIEGQGEVQQEVLSTPNGYYYGTVIKLTAIPDVESAFAFSHWEGDASGTDPQIEVTINGNKNITAVFKRLYTLSVTVEGSGSVLVEPDLSVYLEGTEVTLTAVPDPGWTLMYWEGIEDAPDEPQIFLVMNEDISIGAKFESLFGGGMGDEESPFIINTAQHLDNVRHCLDGYFLQTADIDLTDIAGWYPIGFFFEGGPEDKPFTGVYDGGGFTIDNLTVDVEHDGVGLFAYIDDGAKLQNINLTNASITGASYIGGLVGVSRDGTVDNCGVEADVTSIVTGAGNQVAGLVGLNFEGNIMNSWVRGDVNGGSCSFVGGLTGNNYMGIITNCSFEGSVTGKGNNTGGLAGYMVGGLISHCTLNASVYGLPGAGGIVGANEDGVISNCTTEGYVEAMFNTGGIVGMNWALCNVKDCSSSMHVKAGYMWAGGIAGKNMSTISGCTFTGIVESGSAVGGIVGQAEENSVVIDCYGAGTLSATGNNIGGLVGANLSGAKVLQSHSGGSLTAGDSYAGGLIGKNEGIVENCYSLTVLDGSQQIGGLIGINNKSVTNCFAAGYVGGELIDVGGLIGVNTGDVNSCFYDMAATGQSDEGKGTPKDTSEMCQQATFVGWDFENIWAIDEGESYPYFRE